MINDKLLKILKEVENKYGKSHRIYKTFSDNLEPFIKLSSSDDYIGINVDKILSLINPDKYNFEKVKVPKSDIKL